MIQKSNMHVDGKSDGRAVPTKCPNKSGNPLAEGMEGSRSAEENTEQTTASQTQSWGDALSGLRGVREAAKRDKRLQFTALLHHVSVLLLESSFYALKRDAAPGVDGVTWTEYETGLSERLKDLHSRVHRGTYRAQPSKRAYIPKADGRQRPLGIAALEDKIVQHAVMTVLNQIYEEDFLGFSYGFRPGRRQHDALDALWVGVMRRKVNWILDADIRSFFDEIRHDWLLKFVKHRIADRRILNRVLSGCSSNPNRLRRSFQSRIEFGRYAVANRKERGEGKPETFNFLGFTHICGQTWKTGKFQLLRKTIHQGLSAKLRALKEELRRRRHLSVAELGKWLRSVVQGYFNYHAVPGNLASLRSFRLQVIRRWMRALRRRSQKSRMTWPRLVAIAARWLPQPSILHPYPNLRFDAKHPR